MKIAQWLIVVLVVVTNANAHHVEGLASKQYNIKDDSRGGMTVKFDLTRGIVQSVDSDGSIHQLGRAHMSRATPWDAQQIFGQITIDLANELAGTWYIYK